MDKLSNIFQEMLSIWIDFSALKDADPSWFNIEPDESSSGFLGKQRVVVKQVSGGIKLGVEMMVTQSAKTTGIGKAATTTHVKPVVSANGNAGQSSLIPFKPDQVITLRLDLKEPGFLSVAKDLRSGEPAGSKLVLSNSKKLQSLQASFIPFQSSFSYIPKTKNLNNLSVRNEVTGDIIPVNLPAKGIAITIDAAFSSAGFYQILENDALIAGTEYYQTGISGGPAPYALVKLTQIPAFFAEKQADRSLTISFNPK